MTADGLTEALQRLKADLECVRDHLPTMTLRVSLDRAFEALAAHRAEQAQAPQDYVLALLVAAGHVTQGKVEEARAIASKQAQPAEPVANDWRLPAELKAGHVTFGKGVHCSALVSRMKMLHEAAFGADSLTKEQKDENLAELRKALGEQAPVQERQS